MNTLAFNVPLSLDYDDAVTTATMLERAARDAQERARSCRAQGNVAIANVHQQTAEDCERIALAIRQAIQAEAGRIAEAGQ